MSLPSAHQALIVDASPVARRVIARALGPNVATIEAGSIDQALARLRPDTTLVVSALSLPGGSGQQLAGRVRSEPGHLQTPILIVSGNAQEAMIDQTLGLDVTDHFDKSEGLEALAVFFKGHLAPQEPLVGHVLHVDGSRAGAALARKAMEPRGLQVSQCSQGEDALVLLDHLAHHDRPVDLLVCDHQLEGSQTGLQLIQALRLEPRWHRLQVVATTADDRVDVRRSLLLAGANDLLVKPVRDRVWAAKLRYHLWRAHQPALAPPKPTVRLTQASRRPVSA